MTAHVYANITREVLHIVDRYDNQAEPDVAAYMVMRAALLSIRGRRSAADTSALAYRLADEFATTETLSE